MKRTRDILVIRSCISPPFTYILTPQRLEAVEHYCNVTPLNTGLFAPQGQYWAGRTPPPYIGPPNMAPANFVDQGPDFQKILGKILSLA